MQHCLSIIDENNRLKICYLKAMHHVLLNFPDQSVDKKSLVKSLWQENFNASINFKHKTICFNSDKDKTLFLLRWS